MRCRVFLAILTMLILVVASVEPQTKALKDWLAGRALDEPLLLVTHQVNNTELTRFYPTSGELVIVR